MSAFVSLGKGGIPEVRDDASRAELAAERFLTFVAVLTFGYPALWLIGVGGFYWVLVGLGGAVYLLARRRIAPVAMPAVAVVLALLLSLPVGMAAFGFDPPRVISVFGNLLVWVAVIALITLAHDRPIAPMIARAVLVIGIAQAVLTGVAQAASPRTLPLPLLGGLAHLMPTGLAAFDTNLLYVQDWLGEVAWRSAGVMANPTWAGVFGALTCIVGIATLVRSRGAWRWVALAALPCGLYSVVLSLSRSTEICLAASAVVALLVALRRRNRTAFGVLSVVGALLVATVALAFTSQLGALAVKINDAREGSLTSRSAIYEQTWELFLKLPIPLLGYAIKPKETSLVASVATHSSYLGMLFRGGVLGAIALVLVFAVVLVRSVRAGDPFAAWIVTLTTVWCVLEDFDPGHLLPLGIVLAVAWTTVSKREDPSADGRPVLLAGGRPKRLRPPMPA